MGGLNTILVRPEALSGRAAEEFAMSQQQSCTIRPAATGDADALAELINFAGEGIPVYIWEKAAEPGQSVWDVGRQRAKREEGAFSYRNAVMIEAATGEAAGTLIDYAIADEVEAIPDDMPPMFKPLQELENLVPGSWYVFVLAVYPAFRGQGLGTQLLDHAEATAKANGKSMMSIIISDANHGARALYERAGYREIASRTMVKEDWQNDSTAWVLLTKAL